jgi:hypothetical protein
LRTSTVVDGISNAPPIPWSTRHTMSHGSATEVSGVSPQTVEAPANSTIPIATIRLWPMMSPSRPPRAMNAAVASA